MPTTPLVVKLESSPFPTAEETLERAATAKKAEFKKWEKRVAQAISDHVFVDGRFVMVTIPLSISYEDLVAVCKDLQHCGYEVVARDEYGAQILITGTAGGVAGQPDSVWEVVADAFNNVEKLLSRKLSNPLKGGELRIAIPSKVTKKEESAAAAPTPAPPHAPTVAVNKAINFLTEAPLQHIILLLILSSIATAVTRVPIVHNVVVFAVFVAGLYRTRRWATSASTTTTTRQTAEETQVAAIGALMQAELRAMRAMCNDMEKRTREVDASAAAAAVAAASKKPQEEVKAPAAAAATTTGTLKPCQNASCAVCHK